jgi:hypothetical protein
MSKCVNCGTEQSRAVCPACVTAVLNEAERERIPLVGDRKPEARRIGFVVTPPSALGRLP